MSPWLKSLLGAFAGASLLLSACGGGEDTQTKCPTSGTSLSYQNFGQSFMSVYCTRCHNSALSGSERHGAPGDLNFNTMEGIHAEAKEIDKQSGASATVTNESMPPDGEKPSVEDRRKLSEWLACGAP
ncbi:hypothetical protein [Hyalangium minutum]|uniref:Cytochrome c domain-containing protein n=1 Tax=Hyalangium minutum TaxID=394096 RepID=A0A085WLN0_9BACT|nr:hypothetical protein [Hyalangium minutum]KFE68593.1 hypothetical protein DB31_7830 [Hyalangium minutum]